MPQRTIRRILTLFALALVSATIALAQSPTHVTKTSWQTAQTIAAPNRRIFVVTASHPDRKQSCRVQSITPDNLVCSRPLGATRTYLLPQIAALILPADRTSIHLFLGANAGLGAAIWGTVALAAICPACAAATGIAAVVALLVAGDAIFADDDHPNQLIYLASGAELTGKLRSIQPL